MTTLGQTPDLRAKLAIDRKSVRHVVTFFSERRFDVNVLPADTLRVYKELEGKYNEDYALTFVFIMRTAQELHRAWNMTLLTSMTLQRIKDKFNIRMTWTLGVVKLKFRVEDGGHEIQRIIPYDYDSEYQDVYCRIASALVEGHIDIQEALFYQTEVTKGEHTARSGLFLRDFPGRIILYPLEAATCALIFFQGKLDDAMVAALCGFAAGLVEWTLSSIGGNATKLLDVSAGLVTGIVGSLFYRFNTEGKYCLSAIFMGTLYWFFFGTAFVIGLLEIIAGELETGVTRFIAVTIKTFVLCLGASLGMLIILKEPELEWETQNAENCGAIYTLDTWWRIPLYILCSISVLGQYRMPITKYVQALVVMLVGWEVQTRTAEFISKKHEVNDHYLDNAMSNILGAMSAVIMASIMAYVFDRARAFFYAGLLHRESSFRSSAGGTCLYECIKVYVRLFNILTGGRESDLMKLKMEKKLRKARMELESDDHERGEIAMDQNEKSCLTEALIDSQGVNIWALLMPAIYQLVPGSLIARLWFGTIFNTEESNVFSSLMVIACSLAIGMVLGFALVQAFQGIQDEGLYTIPEDKMDDPEDKCD